MLLMVVAKAEVQRELIAQLPLVFEEAIFSTVLRRDGVAEVVGRTDKHVELHGKGGRNRGVVRRIAAERTHP